MTTAQNNFTSIANDLSSHGIRMNQRQTLGRGSFSTVFLGASSRLRRIVAIKVIDIRIRTEYVDRFLPREMEIVPRLNHSNIVKVYQIIRTNYYVAFLQEYALNGDLLRLIVRVRRIEANEARFLFRQLIEAIRYLSDLNIVHRDIKCENIFLDSYMNVKLGDFGFARILQDGEDTNTHCGSRVYTSLELLQGRRYTGNGPDIWSAGVVLFIMLSGRMPYDEKKPREMIYRQVHHQIPFPRDNTFPEGAKNLITQMLHPQIELRATLSNIINHPWIRGTRYLIRGHVDMEDSASTASSSSPTSIEDS